MRVLPEERIVNLGEHDMRRIKEIAKLQGIQNVDCLTYQQITSFVTESVLHFYLLHMESRSRA